MVATLLACAANADASFGFRHGCVDGLDGRSEGLEVRDPPADSFAPAVLPDEPSVVVAPLVRRDRAAVGFASPRPVPVGALVAPRALPTALPRRPPAFGAVIRHRCRSPCVHPSVGPFPVS